MSTSACSAEKQHPNADVSLDYGPRGPFASSNGRPLISDEFSHILSFLGPKDLARAEGVCRSWNRFINETDQWKRQCRIQLNSGAVDPRTYLPADTPYKEGLKLVLSRVYDEDTYRHYLGAQVEPFPRSSEALSLKRFNEPDPCNPTQTKGQKYFWMGSPSWFKIPVDGDFPFDLDKPDDPNDEDAPRLIPKKLGLVEHFICLVKHFTALIFLVECFIGLVECFIGPVGHFKGMIRLGSKSEKKILTVPNTINNLKVLFKHPKNGNPSTYDYAWEEILAQHGNKRIPQGLICMREDVIGRNLTFAQQQAAAAAAGVVISQLGHRILFNFLRHAKTNAYPDARNPLTFARTSTLTVDSQGTVWPSNCGEDVNPNGLILWWDGAIYASLFRTGAAVALPAEVQAIGP